MLDRRWRTKEEVRRETGVQWRMVAVALAQLRAPAFGGHCLRRRRVDPDEMASPLEYRIQSSLRFDPVLHALAAEVHFAAVGDCDNAGNGGVLCETAWRLTWEADEWFPICRGHQNAAETHAQVATG